MSTLVKKHRYKAKLIKLNRLTMDVNIDLGFNISTIERLKICGIGPELSARKIPPTNSARLHKKNNK